MKTSEAIEVLRLYLKISDAWYKTQENMGLKFTKGRKKFRREVKDAILTLISVAERKK